LKTEYLFKEQTELSGKEIEGRLEEKQTKEIEPI
jgi:hypothetical protein